MLSDLQIRNMHKGKPSIKKKWNFVREKKSQKDDFGDNGFIGDNNDIVKIDDDDDGNGDGKGDGDDDDGDGDEGIDDDDDDDDGGKSHLLAKFLLLPQHRSNPHKNGHWC